MYTEEEAKTKKTGCKHELCLASECMMWKLKGGLNDLNNYRDGKLLGYCGLTR